VRRTKIFESYLRSLVSVRYGYTIKNIVNVLLVLSFALPWFFALSRKKSPRFRILFSSLSWLSGIVYLFVMCWLSVHKEKDVDWRFHIWESCWMYIFLLSLSSLIAVIIAVSRSRILEKRPISKSCF
jgi:hypothetical protein